ncbi:MAG: hypothetical protein AB1489_23990 [Acidobacteriota bacterium]
MFSPVVCARGSLYTALWSWLTKVAAQWLTCTPFVIFSLYVCAEIVPTLVLKLFGYSLLLATLATLWTLGGKITADADGVHQYHFGRLRQSIPWQQLEFRNPFLFTLEKPYIIVRRGGKEMIKIWPSMTGYQALKESFQRHNISLEERTIVTPATSFRSFDDVLKEALK